jgi:hypothetical protein
MQLECGKVTWKRDHALQGLAIGDEAKRTSARPTSVPVPAALTKKGFSQFGRGGNIFLAHLPLAQSVNSSLAAADGLSLLGGSEF